METGATGSDRPGVPHGVMFHRFRSADSGRQLQGALSPEELEGILLRLGIENVVPPEEWMARLQAGTLAPQDVCLTFDDGLRSQLEHALPVLDRYQLRAFWFAYSCVFEGRPVLSEIFSHLAVDRGGMPALIEVFLNRCPADMQQQLDSPAFAAYASDMETKAPYYSTNDIKYRYLRNQTENQQSFESLVTDLVEERGLEREEMTRRIWLSNDDLRALSASGHYIGLHSYDHPYDIAALTPDQQRDQYRRNQDHISSVTGVRPKAMSHPLGSYNISSLQVLEELGVTCGFRAHMLPVRETTVQRGHLELAREDAANLRHRSGDATRPAGR